VTAAARLGVTLGDPSGIGPEIIAATLRTEPALARSLVLFGDRGVLARAGLPAELLDADQVELVEVTRLALADAAPGVPTPAGGAAQVAYLEAAIEAARPGPGALAGLVTAPISKRQVAAAGLGFPGHTELLAERLGAAEHAMAFFGPTLRVVLATIHIPLGEVARVLTAQAVARAIFLGGQALHRDLGIAAPSIGVLGLNPHAGEDGLFGLEEEAVIGPGIQAGRARLLGAGIAATVRGPLVPDAAYRQRHDLFVAMYHDQGLIPVKLTDFEEAVNVTLGLPIVRTSPDHGVAYDIAGKGVARWGSFAAALRLARSMIT
jgi:4-hydroxythreonine-4-phosphate dehydrogenase